MGHAAAHPSPRQKESKNTSGGRGDITRHTHDTKEKKMTSPVGGAQSGGVRFESTTGMPYLGRLLALVPVWGRGKSLSGSREIFLTNLHTEVKLYNGRRVGKGGGK